MGWNTRRKPRSEQGAVAIIVAALTLVLLGVAALGVDLASQVSRKHLLINQLDSAATAAAYEFGRDGSIADAVDAATTFFAENGREELDPHKVDFWCVVARKLNGDNTPLTPAMVADYQIPTRIQGAGNCNPDAVSSSTLWRQSEYQNRTRAWDGKKFSMTCNSTLCAVPCALNASPTNGWNPGVSLANSRPITCNTIRVGAEQDVPFSFAPVLGIDKGSTGSQVSVACAGPCGAVTPNPMDVVVVADRTLSMTDPVGCTMGGSTSSCNHDYRVDLVTGIKGLLQVMTPEQQYVALGALGPSDKTRSSAEGNACNATSRGLVFPGANASTASSGSWVPLSFKKDYLNAPNATGLRTVNTSSKLVQAVNCLDDVTSTGDTRLASTRTALASPLKAAARYLLGKTGDENNIAALGGGDRSGDVQKVIIFETDGEPWEAAATTSSSALTLDNKTDIFSNFEDYTDTNVTTSSNSSSTTGPVLGGALDGTPRNNFTPAVPSPYNTASTYPATYKVGTKTYDYLYKYRASTTTSTTTTTTTTNTTRLYHGGQQACQNFKQIAELAKQQGILIIAIGYNLDGARCSGSNELTADGSSGFTNGPLVNGATTTGTPWISDITPNACRNTGNGSAQTPYTIKTSCAKDMTITYTVPQTQNKSQTRTQTVVTNTQRGDDPLVTEVLASASGGGERPTAVANGCSTADQIAAENGDEDLFFCAARGDEMAPLFVTALSGVSDGVKLIRLP